MVILVRGHRVKIWIQLIYNLQYFLFAGLFCDGGNLWYSVGNVTLL